MNLGSENGKSDLTTRPKWTEVVKDLKEGDVVFALKPNLPRRQWSLGDIIETYPGRDGHTRVAKVQCGKRTVVRPSCLEHLLSQCGTAPAI